jgi:Zn-finger nucleic acid-binding protein
MERRYISIKLPNGTKIDVTEIHITADKEKFLAHSIAADRVMQDMGYYIEAEEYEKLIEQDKVIWENNYQAEPEEDSVKKQAYDKAKARHDKSVNKRDKLVNKMLSTLKSIPPTLRRLSRKS